MSYCDKCDKIFASRQSLWKHRQRKHADRKEIRKVGGRLEFQNRDVSLHSKRKRPDIVQKAVPGQPQELPATKTFGVKEILDVILKPSKKGWLSLSDEKIDEIVTSDDEMESDASVTEDLPSEPEKKVLMTDIKNSELIDVFQKLVHSYFDGDDVELCNDILRMLDELKARSCITDREYIHIKSLLTQQIQSNLYQSINSTIENMIQDDKDEILELLRSMKRDPVAKKLVTLVKNYFEEKMELESVLLLLPKLKDKVNAQKLKIILSHIEKTKNRVNKIFKQLTNGTNKYEALDDLKRSNHITDEQFEKLTIGPHTLPSILRIIQGKGLCLRRK